MKRISRLPLALIAAGVFAAPAIAGVNAKGILVVHTSDAVEYTSDTENYCGMLDASVGCTDEPDCPYPANLCPGYGSVFTPTSGKAAGETAVFWLYAQFEWGPPYPCSRLKGANFTIDYDQAFEGGEPTDDIGISWVAWGPCSDFELADPQWPADGTSTDIIFTQVQRSPLVELYWFAGYSYPNGNPDDESQVVSFRANIGQQKGFWVDDSVPAVQDAIFAYGSMGFAGGVGTNPETPNPVVTKTWGQIKSTYTN